VLVPHDRLSAAGRESCSGIAGTDNLRSTDRHEPPVETPQAAGYDLTDLRSTDRHADISRRPMMDSDRHEDRRLDEILTGVHETAELLRDQLGKANRQIALLTTRLEMADERADRERDRADRAAVRTQEAEARAAEYQHQLHAELIEHRRAMGALAERIPPVRRSWLPWRNRR
jgi:hypothetical protein